MVCEFSRFIFSRKIIKKQFPMIIIPRMSLKVHIHAPSIQFWMGGFFMPVHSRRIAQTTKSHKGDTNNDLR